MKKVSDDVMEAITKMKEAESLKGKPEGEVNLLSIAQKVSRNRKRGQ
jgi:hypothetical protein